jgi:diguanylate cyclase (GGDEF)-like protein
MTQIHDFTGISWGEEFVMDAPIKSISGTITGQGALQAGDHIVLCVKCRVDEVQNYTDSPELWQANISFERPISVEELSEGDPLKAVKSLITRWGSALQQLDIYQRVEQLFISDGLTQLASRSRFETRLMDEWQRMLREQMPLTILVCGIDGMDLYQAAYGKEACDQCLKEIAQVVRGCVKRTSDVVARFEENKFAVLLPNTSAQGADYIAEQVQAQVEALPCFGPTKQPAMTLRLGVATQVPDAKGEAQNLAKTALESLD